MNFNHHSLATFGIGFLLFAPVAAADQKRNPQEIPKLKVSLKLNAIETSTLLKNYQRLVQRVLDLRGSVRECLSTGDPSLPQYQRSLKETQDDLEYIKDRLIKLETEKAKIAKRLTGKKTDVRSEEWNFEDSVPGKLPKGWESAKTGKGPGSVWKVIVDKTSPKGPKVLAQTSSKGPRPLFNLCIGKRTRFKNFDLTVIFKAVRGKVDQGGGPVWRYQDNNNYYVARMNPLEENFRVYKIVDGVRKQLATADAAAPAGKWHTIRIVHSGNRILCYLNGKLHLDVKDATFTKPGKIGLWTKADAVTYFDAVRVEAVSGSKK